MKQGKRKQSARGGLGGRSRLGEDVVDLERYEELVKILDPHLEADEKRTLELAMNQLRLMEFALVVVGEFNVVVFHNNLTSSS